MTRVKTMFHELAVYYVNLQAAKQVNVNESLVRSLNALAKSAEEVSALREEVAELKARLAEDERTA